MDDLVDLCHVSLDEKKIVTNNILRSAIDNGKYAGIIFINDKLIG